jgi:PleD family two-component response regulator
MSGELPSSANMKALGINFCSRLRPVLVRRMQCLSFTMSASVSGEISVGGLRMKSSTLLCVDDDLGILEFYETVLGSNGYRVLLAQDGRQALAVFQERVKEIDAVISDYEMSGMNGIELAAS